jgi:hypothetical protein
MPPTSCCPGVHAKFADWSLPISAVVVAAEFGSFRCRPSRYRRHASRPRPRPSREGLTTVAPTFQPNCSLRMHLIIACSAILRQSSRRDLAHSPLGPAQRFSVRTALLGYRRPLRHRGSIRGLPRSIFNGRESGRRGSRRKPQLCLLSLGPADVRCTTLRRIGMMRPAKFFGS